MKAKKILLLPVGVGLAHVGRCIVLAKELLKRGYEIIIACSAEGGEIVKSEGLPYRKILDFSRDDASQINRLNPFFITTEKMKTMVKAELLLYESLKPDLAISDLRVTAKISTAVYGVPYVSITNTDTTKFYDFSKARLTVPSYWSRHFPERALRLLEGETGQKITKQAFRALVNLLPLPILIHFNRVRREYGLPPLLSIYDVSMGDVTLLADIPEFRPVKKLPFSVFVTGPMIWNKRGKLPEWATSFKTEKKPIIYVTASGTGDPAIFRLLLSFLKNGPWVVVGTVGNALEVQDVSDFTPPQFFITDFLPGDWILPKADLVIFPGGNSTAYQVLSFGVPEIVVPINVDQEDNANQLVRMGVALKIDSHRLSKKKLLESTQRILKESSFGIKAREASFLLKKYNGPKRAVNIIEGYLKMYEQ